MRFSIRDKILLSYICIFGIAFLIMIFFINSRIIKSNENVILTDLEKGENDVNIYSRQFILIKDISDPISKFPLISMDLLKDLNEKMNTEGVMYYRDGSIAGDDCHMSILSDDTQDIKFALKEQSAVTILDNGGRKVAVFSIPIIIENTLIGVYRFSKDYSGLYQYGYSLIKSISIFAVFIGGGIVVVSLLISRSILNPLLKLRDYSKVIGKGEFQVKVDIKSNDEIGELAEQFVKMKDRIYSQIQEIKERHEKLKEIESYRKQFFDNVTHELKTPLTIISGYAQMIEESNFSDKELIIKGIKYIQKESRRLHEMLLNLLSISRRTKDSLKFEKVNIINLLTSVCRDMEIKAKTKGSKIKTEMDKEIFLWGNKEGLRSVFTNVLDNAIKYGESDTVVEVVAFRKEEFAKISITGSGVGIDENLIDKVFEPFFRAETHKDKMVEGSGLGLFISKEIIENHNGAILIDSLPNKGTCVEITLPIKN